MRPRIFMMGLLLLGACQKASDATGERQLPKLPPPPHANVSVHVEVEIDGKPTVPIDANRLGAIKPDFQDPERRAWRMTTLLGPAVVRPQAVVAISGAKGVTVLMRQPIDPKAPVPVLTLSRRGDLLAAMVSPEAPFPPYHGQGRMLSRPGDPLPRIPGVTKIRVYVETGAP